MDEKNRWGTTRRWPLAIASTVFLIVYSWRVITNARGDYAFIADILIAAAWGLFIVDYLVKLGSAVGRWHWFRSHLGDLLIVVLPVLSLVRLARGITEGFEHRLSRAGALRTQILSYGLTAAAILIYLAALLALDIERDAPGSTIVNFGDALWWACVTATTTGYGDIIPVTPIGRMIAVALMFGGVAIAGVITATLASWVFERGAPTHEDSPSASPAQLQDLSDRLDALLARIEHANRAGEARASGERPSASAPAPAPAEAVRRPSHGRNTR